MPGIWVFSSLTEALKAGFQIYDRNSDGYVVRRQGPNGWEQALVVLRPLPSL
jgi:lipid-binding SYLF domain-containing protein